MTFNELLGQVINTTLLGGKDSDQHLTTLFSLVIQTKAKSILELGVRYGDTTLPLTLGTYLVAGTVDAVDILPTEYQCPEILKPHWNFIQSDAIEFLENNTKYYDLIYIDDWHSYSHVKKELELIDKFADNKTLILLHDLMGCWSNPNYFYPIKSAPFEEWGEGGPYAAVKELNLEKWEYSTIPVCNGLTILRKK